MKILVANPNSSEICTDVIIKSARRKVTDPNTELVSSPTPREPRTSTVALLIISRFGALFVPS